MRREFVADYETPTAGWQSAKTEEQVADLCPWAEEIIKVGAAGTPSKASTMPKPGAGKPETQF